MGIRRRRRAALRLQPRRGHEPLSAETKYALSIRLVGPTITGKRVQGPVVIGDLLTACSGDDAKLARKRGASRRGHAGRKKRRPGVRALSGADDPATALGYEVVKGSTLLVDQDRTQGHVARDKDAGRGRRWRWSRRRDRGWRRRRCGARSRGRRRCGARRWSGAGCASGPAGGKQYRCDEGQQYFYGHLLFTSKVAIACSQESCSRARYSKL